MHQFKAYQEPKVGGPTRKAPTSNFPSESSIHTVVTVRVPIHQENATPLRVSCNNLFKTKHDTTVSAVADVLAQLWSRIWTPFLSP